MQEYQWWGSKNEPPAHLKTKKQLAEMGLAPVNPVGFIQTKKYTVYLYSIKDFNSVRDKKQPTESQLNNLKKAREQHQKMTWYKHNWQYEKDRIESVKSAFKIISESNYLILDTETTGLDNQAEMIEIAIINHQGVPLINTLIKPTINIPKEAQKIHHISDFKVRKASSFLEIYPQLQTIFKHKTILIYNAKFDMKIINYCCQIYGLPKLKMKTVCLMELYSQWYGEYSSYRKQYKWQPLPNAGHRALDDCLACLAILKEMAGDSQDIKYPDFSES